MIYLNLINISKAFNSRLEPVLKDISLKLDKGEILALLGESGSGKTTLLRIIAGFELPSAGEVIIGSETMVKLPAFVPPEKRRIGMVFQDYVLFPHLRVSDNIAFGLVKKTKAEKQRIVGEILEIVGMSGFQHRYPHELSGGQQQRVALARALALSPRLLLLDEPFSNLDANLKEQMRSELRRIIKETGTTAVFVTHDTKDAMVTADKTAILYKGIIQQFSTPRDIYHNPVNGYVAGFFGKVNIIEGVKTAKGFDTPIGFIETVSENRQEKVKILIRPENFLIDDSAVPEAVIEETLFYGDYQEVRFKINNVPLTAYLPDTVHFEKGSKAAIRPDLSKVYLIPG